MKEQSQLQSLADRALDRLKKLARGNGLDLATITVFDVQEQTVELQGSIFVSPLCETESLSYPGAPRGKERRLVHSFGELQSSVEKHKNDFSSNMEWLEAVVQQLKTHETQGWGLENAKVTLPERSTIYAATQTCPECGGRQTITCPQCLGRGTLNCDQCQARGREICYYCSGRGEDPQNPGSRCPTCGGTRYATCRICQGRGYVFCPVCKGNKGTPCPNCGGTGQLTQEVKVTCGVKTRFAMEVEGLASGVRRGLDRIGIQRLGNGHADLSVTQPKGKDDTASLVEKPILHYTATLPYAEMKMSLGGKKAVISALGKRCVITGVPPFLDASLKPWLDKLHQAALGKASLNDALGARAIKEILTLVISGKGTEREVRKYYPYGLSSGVITSMLSDMRQAVQQTTLKARAAIAVFCLTLSALLFFAVFGRGFESRLTQNWRLWGGFGFDLALLAFALGASWAILNFSTRFFLQRRFPQNALALHQKTGYIGLAMMAAIAVAFVAALWLAPVKPFWLLWLLLGS